MTRNLYVFAFIGLLLASFTTPTAAFSQEKKKKTRLLAPSMGGLEFRDAATHSQLSLALREARKTNPMKDFKATTLEKDPSTENAPKDIIKDSDILCLNGAATLIPKRAVLNLPDRFAGYFKMKEGAKILTFPAFYAANRGWIMTYEVSIEQAFGKKPFDKKKMKWIKKSGRVVVATFKGGPITVLPYVEEKEEEDNSEKEPAS